MPILHECSNYLVRYNRPSKDDVAVVAFSPWSHSPSLEGDFFGEPFFRNRGINAIGIKAARNDWYQGAAMDEVIQTIRLATRGMRLVGYGGSMGGYAVINFSEDLHLDAVLSIGPQFSINPAKVPFETRWLGEAREVVFRNDKIDRIARIHRGWVVYDPTTTDARHFQLIQPHHNLIPIHVYFADHHPYIVLRQTGLIEPLLLDLVHDRVDQKRFVGLLRQKRRSSEWVWLHLSKLLQARGNLGGALRAIEFGKGLQGTYRFQLDVQHAELLIRSGDRDAAMAMIVPYIDDTDHGREAHWRIRNWLVVCEKPAASTPTPPQG